jgi:SAM-dependent methyltransferase
MSKLLIENLNCKVVGVDTSASMRVMAAALVDNPAFVAIAPGQFDTHNSFDAAISIWTLQHCFDLGVATGHISRAVKPGGRLVIASTRRRCVPIANGGWLDDGQDVHGAILASGFECIEDGVLDESVAPGWMQRDTFWAAYERAPCAA